MSNKTLADLRASQISYKTAVASYALACTIKDSALPDLPDSDDLDGPEWRSFDDIEDALNVKHGVYTSGSAEGEARTRLIECFGAHMCSKLPTQFASVESTILAALGRPRVRADGTKTTAISFMCRKRIVDLAIRLDSRG